RLHGQKIEHVDIPDNKVEEFKALLSKRVKAHANVQGSNLWTLLCKITKLNCYDFNARPKRKFG
ncbi:MAG: hypothetical protein VXW29_13060, partial [SAR324 cluster bacterium]|nr:hypothetical protein [SAR324 cluster bacterium]